MSIIDIEADDLELFATATAEETADDFDDDDPDEVAEWSGPIGMEGERTGDGRLIKTNALRWDTLPVPLRWAESDYGAHDGAVVVGKITDIERITLDEANKRLSERGQSPLTAEPEAVLWGSGVYDLGSEKGREAFRQADEQLTPGISMDLDDVVIEDADTDRDDDFDIAEGRVRAGTMVAIPAFEGARIAVKKSETFNWVDDVGGLPEYIKRISNRLKAKGMVESHAIATAVNVVKRMCATGDVNFPGVQNVNAASRARACAAVAEWEEKKARARASRAETVTLVAGGSKPATRLPRDWFTDPSLSGPTPITVRDGRVFGHLALWNSCHIAEPQGPGVCTKPPYSPSGYAYFHTGEIDTDAGPVPVGHLTMNTLHAGPRMRAVDTQYHYEHTGVVAADVVAGEDSFGIWVSGRVRPGVDEAAFRSAPISGDWRAIGGNLELVAALSVNVPGFPVPRPKALVASGEVLSLVASGIVDPDLDVEDQSLFAFPDPENLTDDQIRSLRERFVTLDRSDRFDALRAKANRVALEAKVRQTRASLGLTPHQRGWLTAAVNESWKTQIRVPKGNPAAGRWMDMPGSRGADLWDSFSSMFPKGKSGNSDLDRYMNQINRMGTEQVRVLNDPNSSTEDKMAALISGNEGIAELTSLASGALTSRMKRDQIKKKNKSVTDEQLDGFTTEVRSLQDYAKDAVDIDWSLFSEGDLGDPDSDIGAEDVGGINADDVDVDVDVDVAEVPDVPASNESVPQATAPTAPEQPVGPPNPEVQAAIDSLLAGQTLKPKALSDAEEDRAPNPSLRAHIVDGDLSPERKETVMRPYLETSLGGLQSSENPKYTMMGGGPGAGKSTLIRMREGTDTDLSAGRAIVNADIAKTGGADEDRPDIPPIPDYATSAPRDAATNVHEESAAMAATFLDVATQNKLDVLNDGVGDGKVTNVLSKIKQARDSGYPAIEGQYTTIPTADAILRAQIRGYTQGRYVNPEIVYFGHSGVSSIFTDLAESPDGFDTLDLWDTSTRDPIQIARQTERGGPLEILDQNRWDEFIAKGEQPFSEAMTDAITEAERRASMGPAELARTYPFAPYVVDGVPQPDALANLAKMLNDAVRDLTEARDTSQLMAVRSRVMRMRALIGEG